MNPFAELDIRDLGEAWWRKGICIRICRFEGLRKIASTSGCWMKGSVADEL